MNNFKKLLSAFLAVLMVFAGFPVVAFAAENDLNEDALLLSEEGSVETYPDFLENLKVLEGYANEFAATSSKYKDTKLLVVNFIRCGVERYTEGLWNTLAQAEITEFTDYVKASDIENGTTAMCLRDIIVDNFILPGGNQTDFGHMFGTMNISYVAPNSSDLAGWAGDLCDLVYYSKKLGVPDGTIEEKADYIRTLIFGRDAEDAFGMDDFYGDLDAYYIMANIKSASSISAIMEDYFVSGLDDGDRAIFFLNNRFDFYDPDENGVVDKEEVREAVFEAYSNDLGIKVLESERGIGQGDEDCRKASCYAFADYLYSVIDPSDIEISEKPDDSDEPAGDNEYYSVFSSTETNIAPGVKQTIKYAMSADKKQMVYYLAEVDINRNDVTIKTNYHNADPSEGWAMQRVKDQAEAMQKKYGTPGTEEYIENFNVVLATNGAGFNMSNGKPSGLVVMDGKEWTPVDSKGFFAILDDGSAVIGTTAEYDLYKDRIREGIAGFGDLIRDGEVIASNDGGRASRTAIGIKADGSVVMMVLDGRQEPVSCGGTMREIAQIMLDAGCVDAINLDGGGSTTFVSKPEGEKDLKVINRPSDGYARSVSTSLAVVSTALVSKEFSYASISSEYSYLTVGTSIEFTATGVSVSGHPAEIPENAEWVVSDEKIGSVTSEGVFTAKALGTAEVQIVVDGKVVGRRMVNVVVPDALNIEESTMNVIYGVEYDLPLTASYKGNPVAFGSHDVMVLLQYSNAGSVKGLKFKIYETSGYRTLIAGAGLIANPNVIAMTTLKVYRADEAVFDFSDVTAGDKKFAWKRVVSNATTEDGIVYQITETDKPMELAYTFAIDMEQIDIPEKLKDLVYMLPGDGVEGNDTAWDFLLQLAERVSTLTNVKIKIQLDKDLDVDISDLRISNDFFSIGSVEYNEETGILTIVANWIDRTESVDKLTANPICVLSGLKATPKEDAEWNAKNQLPILNIGEVTYDVYLRASALYSFAIIETNQKTYDLYPFINPNDASEKGASYSSEYASFEDNITIDRSGRQGWYKKDGALYYYEDSKPVTGYQLLPGYEDSSVELYYFFDENGVCKGTVTGLASIGGDLFYAIAGEGQVGWHTAVNESNGIDYYYFSPQTGAAVDGKQKIGGHNYEFVDKKLVKGELVTDAGGTRYYWAGTYVKDEWIEVDGREGYAQRGGYLLTGLWKRYYKDDNIYYFAFGEDGFWMKEFTGKYDYNGKTYYIENGYVIEYPGLIKIGDDYYYFCSNGSMVKNCSYWFSKPNGIVPNGRYNIDENGVVDFGSTVPKDPDAPVNPKPEDPKPDEPKLNGIVKGDDGVWYYYVDGVKTYAGLIYIDGYYYYVNSKCEVMHDCDYWISKNNGYMGNRMYSFDEEGRMIMDENGNPADPSKPTVPDNPPVNPDDPVDPDPEDPKPEDPKPDDPVLSGIVKGENGTWYYYENGVKTYAGLIMIDGYYYYVNSKCQVMHDCDYWISKNNDLMKNRLYSFDEEGRMIMDDSGTPVVPGASTTPKPEDPNPGEPKLNGIVKGDDGVWYYYVDGVKTYAGLIMIDGYYYYVNSKCEVVYGQSYWISKNNGYMHNNMYTFDDEGRLILTGEPDIVVPEQKPEDPSKPLNGIVKVDDDTWYYYVDGVKTYAGLIIIDGYYYYVDSKCMVKHDCSYWISKNNGYMKNGSYTFDAEGRIVDIRP